MLGWNTIPYLLRQAEDKAIEMGEISWMLNLVRYAQVVLVFRSIIGIYDAFDEMVTNNILLVELYHGNAFDVA